MTTVPQREPLVLSSIEHERFAALAQDSYRIITSHQQPSGAYPAAPTFSAYQGYAWLRDGSFTAEGTSRYGGTDSAERFHDWVDDVLTARRGVVDTIVAAGRDGVPTGELAMLPTRFTYDGRNGSDPWWDFQTDGYGTWLWSVVSHSERHGTDLASWRSGMEVAVDYLAATWHLPCYDWWEEHVEQRHTSTLGSIYGGLTAVVTTGVLDAARADRAAEVCRRIRELVEAEAVVDGHLTKWLGTSEVDGSLAACVVPFGLVDADDDRAGATLAAVQRDLDTDGGVHRFRGDVFYGGGQWLLLSALLGWNLAARGDRNGALHHLRWIADQAGPAGDLPEQVAGHLLHPATRDEWVAKWGPVASPLLWSHGMYLILADELGLARLDEVRTAS